jgi:carboxymethylenebutenolidase
MPETSFTRPDGKSTGCYVAEPHGPVKGNIIVVQEWWGLNDHIKKICDRFASKGYRALAPDLYHGVVATTRDEAQHSFTKLNWSDAVSQDMAGAMTFLRSKGGKVCLSVCLFSTPSPISDLRSSFRLRRLDIAWVVL